MAKYRKKPVEVEAFRLGIDYIPDWFMDKVTSNEITLLGTSSGFEHHDDTNADIKTLEGVMHANFGDFIIKGIKGEIYPCKPDIFYATYEESEVAERREDIENSPADCSTPSVTDSKGERNEHTRCKFKEI